MVLMLDGLGTRYHMLPSQILSTANTFDLFIMERAMTYAYDREMKKQNPNYIPKRMQLTEAQMMDAIRQVNSKTK